jgi:hypothetical protein
MPRISFAPWARHTLSLLLSLVTAAAMALPSPKDIDAAVAAGHLSQAETLLREVIQEKPNSAKAQYELGQVLARQARYTEAQAALAQAKTLDPSLKFAASPEKFNEVLNQVSQQVKSASVATPAPALTQTERTSPQTVPLAPEPAFPLHYVWIGLAGLVVLALVLRRPKAATTTPSASMSAAQAANGRPFGAGQPVAAGHGPSYGPGQGPGYAPGYPGVQPVGGGMGSGIGGAVVGGLAGVAAGYALSKALEGEHHSNPGQATPPNAGNPSGYVPFENPAPTDLGSFDSGSGSGWDDASADSGSDDW